MGSVRNLPTTKVYVWRCGSRADHLIFPTDWDGSERMYSSSAVDARGCRDGLGYRRSQNMRQTNPSAPVKRKVERQPQSEAIHGARSGVTMAPTLVPALKMPVAKARSFLGNHSATLLMLAGKTPASPKTSAKRAAAKMRKEPPAACGMEARRRKSMA